MGNHPSANEHPLVISQAIALETQAGRLIGPLDPKLFPFAHVSSLGAVPKKHSDNKWRLILDLSLTLLAFLHQSGFHCPKNSFLGPRNTPGKDRY